MNWSHCNSNRATPYIEMKSRTLGLRVAGTMFGLLCLAQLLRLATEFEVVLAGHKLPLWPSAVAVVIAGALSLWLWKLSASSPP